MDGIAALMKAVEDSIEAHGAARAVDVAALLLQRRPADADDLVKNWSKRQQCVLDRRSLGQRGRPPLVVASMSDVDAIAQLAAASRGCPAGASDAFQQIGRPRLLAAFAAFGKACLPRAVRCRK